MTTAAGWKIQVRHETGYRYPNDVVASYNEARLTPQTTAGQTTIDARLEVQPRLTPSRYWDYWGTLVHAFDVHQRHRELVVTATSVVETPVAHAPAAGAGPTWADLDDTALRDRFFEYLAPTAAVPTDPELSVVARELRALAPTPRDAVELASGWVRDRLVYEKGSTTVATSPIDAWRAGHGVCQDFVQLTLVLLRGMGVPARYVSGYFHPQPDAAIGDPVSGDSHAWCEAWTGSWHPFDPTNAINVGHRHVIVARGREYRDVTPIKGIYSGAPSSTTTVGVVITRQG
ncbi:MAG: transglutaminase protein [Acidimicrobiales bacterium]|nr:transglutaminase protein [Acidimicrobiales bacterium]